MSGSHVKWRVLTFQDRVGGDLLRSSKNIQSPDKSRLADWKLTNSLFSACSTAQISASLLVPLFGFLTVVRPFVSVDGARQRVDALQSDPSRVAYSCSSMPPRPSEKWLIEVSCRELFGHDLQTHPAFSCYVLGPVPVRACQTARESDRITFLSREIVNRGSHRV